MRIKPDRRQEDSETIYRLLRQALSVTTAVAEVEYPMTAYLLRIAAASLDDEMAAAIKSELLHDRL